MRRAVRKWKNALPVIGFLCLALTIAMAVYTYRYEPDRYSAGYTFFALPSGVNTDENALVQARMLARDCDELLRTPSFRQSVLQTAPSDGKTFLSAETVNGSHMISVKAVGLNPSVVCELANGAGRALMQSARDTLRATDTSEIAPAELPAQPSGPNRPLKIAAMLVASFLLLSLLGLLFGSPREPVCFRRGRPPLSEPPCLAAVADCAQTVREQAKAERKGRSVGTLYERTQPLTRDNVRTAALALRSMLDGRSGSVAVAGMDADENNAALCLLLASELAAQGSDVLLMEADGAAPALHTLLNAHAKCDLADCLRDQNALREAILPTPIPRLCFMDLFRDEGFIAAAAATEAFASFLSDAAQSFDYVLLNAPAVSAGSNAAMLGALTDLTLLLAPDGRCSAEEIQSAAGELSRAVKRLGGFVLYGVPKRRFGSARG